MSLLRPRPVGVRSRRLLVVGDSLTFYGPDGGELVTETRLFPHVAATLLSTVDRAVSAKVVARIGWTARDAWWALTRDPQVYSVLLPRADAVVLAVGNMDYLPSTVPSWLREGIRYLRPAELRRTVRGAYRALQPWAARITPFRALPQHLTDNYLSRCVRGIRYFHPGMLVIGVLPPPHRAPSYGFHARGHGEAVAAARSWGRRENVPMVDLPACVTENLLAGRANPDGMHFGWESHAAVGAAIAGVVGECWRRSDR